jgi:hypothetical protein
MDKYLYSHLIGFRCLVVSTRQIIMQIIVQPIFLNRLYRCEIVSSISGWVLVVNSCEYFSVQLELIKYPK